MKENNYGKGCIACKFIENVFPDIQSNKEYWQMTEVFNYLHGGDDHYKKMSQRKLIKFRNHYFDEEENNEHPNT